jgi:hypothetical protein
MMKQMAKRSLFYRLRRRILREALAYEARKGDHYMTSRARPKGSDAIGLSAADCPRYSTQPVLRAEPMAIVMQGPIWAEDEFTIETVRLYRKLMPHCRIVLSTWRDAPEDVVRALASLDVDVVLNDKPERPGPFNVNMQIASAAGGMRRAAELGVDWVLKTRTDQRLYHPTSMDGLIALARLFPPTGQASQTQRYRIFGLTPGTLKFGLYHICDQTVFGHIDDMLAYWAPPFRNEDLPAGFPTDPHRIFTELSIRDLCRYAAPEAYFGSQFLLRQGRTLDWTLADSWAAFRDHFGVVDLCSSDFYWVKGQLISMRDGLGSYAALTNAANWTFLEWAQLVTGALPTEAADAYESVLDERTALFDPGYP